MNKSLDEILKLILAKFPEKQNDGDTWTKLHVYTDGSGEIYRGQWDDKVTVKEFDNIEELVAFLEDRKPNPTF